MTTKAVPLTEAEESQLRLDWTNATPFGEARTIGRLLATLDATRAELAEAKAEADTAGAMARDFSGQRDAWHVECDKLQAQLTAMRGCRGARRAALAYDRARDAVGPIGGPQQGPSAMGRWRERRRRTWVTIARIAG